MINTYTFVITTWSLTTKKDHTNNYQLLHLQPIYKMSDSFQPSTLNIWRSVGGRKGQHIAHIQFAMHWISIIHKCVMPKRLPASCLAHIAAYFGYIYSPFKDECTARPKFVKTINQDYKKNIKTEIDQPWYLWWPSVHILHLQSWKSQNHHKKPRILQPRSSAQRKSPP